MIGRLTGRILECSPGAVLLDVGGVGYSLQIPLSTFYTFAGATDGPVSLHVHTHVREDALQLYGFSTREERSAFERLIAISGVGPKIALAVLSGIGVGELDRAIREGDRAKLQRIPGIGHKTAERLLVELKDRVGRESRSSGRRDPRSGHAAGELRPAPGVRTDAVSALVNLGYPRDVAEDAVNASVPEVGDELELETLLRTALRALVR